MMGRPSRANVGGLLSVWRKIAANGFIANGSPFVRRRTNIVGVRFVISGPQTTHKKKRKLDSGRAKWLFLGRIGLWLHLLCACVDGGDLSRWETVETMINSLAECIPQTEWVCNVSFYGSSGKYAGAASDKRISIRSNGWTIGNFYSISRWMYSSILLTMNAPDSMHYCGFFHLKLPSSHRLWLFVTGKQFYQKCIRFQSDMLEYWKQIIVICSLFFPLALSWLIGCKM